MATWDTLAQLPVAIEGYSLTGLEHQFSPEFTRMCTVVTLEGGGETGSGEDVIYDGLDHVAFQAAGPVLDLAMDGTLGEFAERLDALDLFPDPPVRDESRDYRRWAFESAALDLALAQGGRTLGEVLGREISPLNYVVSMRLTGEPETAERLLDVLARYPGTRFKLDPTNTWSPELIAELAATGAVDSLDLKGHYKDTPVDVDTDAELYATLAETFPDAWLEDPDLDDPAAAEALAPHHDRITWDAPIHSVADIDALPFPPRTVNIKPSRFGPLERLFAAYDACAERGIGAYGGGQSELGIGRDQIQYLAALMHPDTPNDTAPKEFNLTPVPDGLPSSPIDLPIARAGLRLAPDSR